MQIHVVAAFDGGSIVSDTGLPQSRRLDHRLSLFNLARATDPLGQVMGSLVHDDTPPLEQVGTVIGCLDPVADHMRQVRFHRLPRMVRPPFRPAVSLSVAAIGSAPRRSGRPRRLRSRGRQNAAAFSRQ